MFCGEQNTIMFCGEQSTIMFCGEQSTIMLQWGTKYNYVPVGNKVHAWSVRAWYFIKIFASFSCEHFHEWRDFGSIEWESLIISARSRFTNFQRPSSVFCSYSLFTMLMKVYIISDRQMRYDFVDCSKNRMGHKNLAIKSFPRSLRLQTFIWAKWM